MVQTRGSARGGLAVIAGALALGCLPSGDLADYSRGRAGAGAAAASGGNAGASAAGSSGGGGAAGSSGGSNGAGSGAADAAVPLQDAGERDSGEPLDAALRGCAAGGELGPDQQTCYYLSLAASGWVAANQSCTANARRLVKVESAAEDAFIAGLSGANLWIGASDLFVDGNFVWSDNSPILFANWGPAQPDAFPGPDCVEKRQEAGERWYDQPCADVKQFVCEAAAQ